MSISHHEANNLIVFVAHNAGVEIHKHHCFQILISLNQPFTSHIHGDTYTGRGLIINQTIAHACQAINSNALVYFIDAESRRGWQLKQMLDGQPYLNLEHFWSENQWATLSADAQTHAWQTPALQILALSALDTLLPMQPDTAHHRDPRITQVIDWLETTAPPNVTLQDAATLLCLSTEHTRHLFVQETGVAFSQFLLWKRIKQAMIRVLHDQLSLTDAALQSGFADQAHFCRLFKRTFGISPKRILKNSRYIQFLIPSLGQDT